MLFLFVVGHQQGHRPTCPHQLQWSVDAHFLRPSEPPNNYGTPNASARATSDSPTPCWPEGIAERVLLHNRGALPDGSILDARRRAALDQQGQCDISHAHISSRSSPHRVIYSFHRRYHQHIWYILVIQSSSSQI